MTAIPLQVQWHKNMSKHQSCNLLLLWCRRLSQTLGAVSSCLLTEFFYPVWLKSSKTLTTWRVGALLAQVSFTWLGPSSPSASWLRCQKERSEHQSDAERAVRWQQNEAAGTRDVISTAISVNPRGDWNGRCERGIWGKRYFFSLGSRRNIWSISKIYLWHQYRSRKMLFSQCPLLVVWGHYKLLQKSFAVCMHGTCSKRVSPGCPSPLKGFGSRIGLWHRSSLCFGCWPLRHRECTWPLVEGISRLFLPWLEWAEK